MFIYIDIQHVHVLRTRQGFCLLNHLLIGQLTCAEHAWILTTDLAWVEVGNITWYGDWNNMLYTCPIHMRL
jgi:hypothetical protein